MKSASVVVVLVAVVMLAALGLTSCGSGGGVGPPPPPPVISVSVSPTSANVQVGTAQQFTPTVANDSSNAGVTWTLSGSGCTGNACGTLSAGSSLSGVAVKYTAPASVPSPATVTVTAKSVTDPTKSANATVTVTAAQQATITSATPPVFGCNSEYLCGESTVKLGGLNFTKSCQETISPAPNAALSSAQFIGPTEIDLHLGFDTPTFNPGQFTVQACTQSQQTTSNTFTIGMKTNRNMAAVDPTNGNVFLLSFGGGGLPVVSPYQANGTPMTPFAGGGWAMALDDKTQKLIFVSVAQVAIVIDNEDGSGYGGGNWYNDMLDVDAKGGYLCVFEPKPNSRILCFDIANDRYLQNPFTYTSLNDPCAHAMVQGSSTLYLLVMNCGTNTVSSISVPDMTLQGSLTLTGITSVGSGNTLVEVAGLSSGVGAIMSPVDGKLFLFNLGSMTAIGNPVPLDGYPEGLTANKSADSFEVTYASTPQAVPTSAELADTAGDKPTKLHLSSTNFPLGHAVSPDGTKLYVGDRSGKIDVQKNQ